MLNLKQQLPPLNSLVTFEAAARHLSFTLAADELNVTQAAVSRQIKTLELHLATTLFTRNNRRLSLTPAAHKLLPSIRTAFGLIISSVDELHHIDDTTVTISATIAFSTLKLNRWLTDFQNHYPEIDVRVIATDRDIDLQNEGVDLAIGCGDYGQNNQLKTTLLFNDEVFPVCSPYYLKTHGGLNLPQDLLQHQLLHLDGEHWRDLSWQAIDWQVWFNSQSITPPTRVKGLKINNYPLLMQAVINGQGIALGWRHLVSDLLQSGELVQPLSASLKSQRAYYLVQSSECSKPSIKKLADWILTCANIAN